MNPQKSHHYENTTPNELSDYHFTQEVFNQSNLIINEDSIGEIYPTIVKGEATVIKITMKKDVIEGVADSEYSETIHFQLKNKKSNLYNNNLQELKVLYGKHCFCRGEAGYIKLTEGTIKIEETTAGLNYTIEIPVIPNKNNLFQIYTNTIVND